VGAAMTEKKLFLKIIDLQDEIINLLKKQGETQNSFTGL
jgi:hypothetical protein